MSMQIGIVSDDELLDLLDLALSSDTSNTVRRARELMRSRIDPMQLISQLANLIMDILAGKCQEGTSEVRRNFFEGHTCKLSLFCLNIDYCIFIVYYYTKSPFMLTDKVDSIRSFFFIGEVDICMQNHKYIHIKKVCFYDLDYFKRLLPKS